MSNDLFKQLTIKRKIAEQLDEIRGKDNNNIWQVAPHSYSWVIEQLLKHKARLKP